MMSKCENNGCDNEITVPSLDCPGQCLPCAIESRERVEAGRRVMSLSDWYSERMGGITNAELLALFDNP